jgi:hypothetical protein
MRMAQILPFVNVDYDFDPDTVAKLGAAFDEAVAQLQDQPNAVREIVVQRIIALATEGERDPHRLSDKALAAIGFVR